MTPLKQALRLAEAIDPDSTNYRQVRELVQFLRTETTKEESK